MAPECGRIFNIFMVNKSYTQLKFLCFGVGAIGTYIGGSLALAGQKVVFLEREEIAKQVVKRGLHLKLPDGQYHYSNPDVVSTIDKALTHGPFDLAILAVKSYDTESLLQLLASYSIALPPILCLQNGVENEQILTDILGDNKVISGTVTTAVGKVGPGDIVLEKLRGVGISTSHVLAPTLAAVMDDAGLRARQYKNALSMKWSKLLTNILANASSAILNMTPAEIYQHPGLFDIEMRSLREALHVMHAQRIPVTDLPGIPVRLLAFAAEILPRSLSRPVMVRSVGSGRGNKMPSFHIDLRNNHGKSEIEYLNGAVARFGEQLGLQTPVNATLTEIMKSMTAGVLDKDTYARQPEKFIALFD